MAAYGTPQPMYTDSYSDAGYSRTPMIDPNTGLQEYASYGPSLAPGSTYQTGFLNGPGGSFQGINQKIQDGGALDGPEMMTLALITGGAGLAAMGAGAAGGAGGLSEFAGASTVDPMMFGGTGAATWGAAPEALAGAGGLGGLGAAGGGGGLGMGGDMVGVDSGAGGIGGSGISWGQGLNLVKGIAGFAQGQQSSGVAQQTANTVLQRSDPFYAYRAGWANTLQQYAQGMPSLSPTSTDVLQLPGFQAGLEAVQRAGAAQGFTGSGNMAVALSKYGGDFFNQERNYNLEKFKAQQQAFGQNLSQFGRFAGADMSPNTGTYANLIGGGLSDQQYGQNQLLKGLGGMFGQGGGGGAAPTPTVDPGMSLGTGDYTVSPDYSFGSDFSGYGLDPSAGGLGLDSSLLTLG